MHTSFCQDSKRWLRQHPPWEIWLHNQMLRVDLSNEEWRIFFFTLFSSWRGTLQAVWLEKTLLLLLHIASPREGSAGVPHGPSLTPSRSRCHLPQVPPVPLSCLISLGQSLISPQTSWKNPNTQKSNLKKNIICKYTKIKCPPFFSDSDDRYKGFDSIRRCVTYLITG